MLPFTTVSLGCHPPSKCARWPQGPWIMKTVFSDPQRVPNNRVPCQDGALRKVNEILVSLKETWGADHILSLNLELCGILLWWGLLVWGHCLPSPSLPWALWHWVLLFLSGSWSWSFCLLHIFLSTLSTSPCFFSFFITSFLISRALFPPGISFLLCDSEPSHPEDHVKDNYVPPSYLATLSTFLNVIL